MASRCTPPPPLALHPGRPFRADPPRRYSQARGVYGLLRRRRLQGSVTAGRSAASSEAGTGGSAGHDAGVLLAAESVDVEEAKRLIEREGYKVLDVR